MGLKHLNHSLRQPTVDVVDSLDTVRTIEVSCEAALDVLNDLVTRNNIDKGLLLLEKTQLEVWPLFRDIFHPYALQVRLILYRYKCNIDINVFISNRDIIIIYRNVRSLVYDDLNYFHVT